MNLKSKFAIFVLAPWINITLCSNCYRVERPQCDEIYFLAIKLFDLLGRWIIHIKSKTKPSKSSITPTEQLSFLSDRSWVTLTGRYEYWLSLTECLDIFRDQLVLLISMSKPPKISFSPSKYGLSPREAHWVILTTSHLSDNVRYSSMINHLDVSRSWDILSKSKAQSSISSWAPRVNFIVYRNGQGVSCTTSDRDDWVSESRELNCCRVWDNDDIVYVIVLIF